METSGKPKEKGFEGKNFYLDLQNSPQVCTQLTQYITQLGGTIKEFLNENVRYIITLRPKDQWPPKRVSTGRSGQLLALDSIREQSVQSPIDLNKNSTFSRGKLLLKMVSKPTLPTDVLELARIWNITIMRAIDVLNFCKTHLSPRVEDSVTAPSSQIKRLEGSYIKAEDNRLQHKPIYKEFYEWPQINYDFHELLCPFVKKKVEKEATDDEPIESLEGLAVKNRFDHKLKTCLNTTNTTTNDTISTNTKSKQKTSQKTKTLVKSRLTKKRRSPAFCEICGTDYEDLSKHLKSELHETYTKNEDNYKELKGVISSLQPFLEAKRLQLNPNSDSEEETDEEPCSPFQSTPNMLTTIHLNGSKHKSHFLSIHDIIANQSPLFEDDDKEEDKSVDWVGSECQSAATDPYLIPPSNSTPKSAQKMKFLNNSCLSVYEFDNKSVEL